MDAKAIERALKDCGVPGRLVGLERKVILLDILDDSTEKLERVSLGVSEFCDLVLDWRARLAARTTQPQPAILPLVPASNAA